MDTKAEELKLERKIWAALLPKIPLRENTFVYMGVGWAALIMFPVWLPIVAGYLGLWALHELGTIVTSFSIGGAEWLGKRAQEKNP